MTADQTAGQPPAASRRRRSPAALQHPGFRRLTTAWVFTNIADSALYLMLAVWIKDLTGSDSAAALTFAMLGLPALLAPFLGQIADRYSRKRLLVIANLLVAGVVTTLLLVDSADQIVWIYAVVLVYASVACLNFEHYGTRTCLVGHTHLPAIFVGPDDEGEDCQVVPPLVGGAVELGEERYIINPGSVGQPRDGDSRAAYLTLDAESGTIEHRRVAYDIEAVQAKMREVALPPRSIARLEYGW